MRNNCNGKIHKKKIYKKLKMRQLVAGGPSGGSKGGHGPQTVD